MIDVLYTATFEKNYKRLAKKYPSLKDDLAAFIDDLRRNPRLGIALGDDSYKIRLAVKSKGRGKSGGLRMITFVQVVGKIVYLLTLYDKAEMASVSDREIKEAIQLIRSQF